MTFDTDPVLLISQGKQVATQTNKENNIMDIITDFVAPEAPGRFDADIAALLKATEENPAAVGAFTFDYDAEKVTADNDAKALVQKDVRAVQASATKVDRTARVVDTKVVKTEDDTDAVRVVFKLVAKVPFRKETTEAEAAPVAKSTK